MFKIWNDGDNGRDCHVEIDGEDMSGLFSSLVITADIKSAVKIELEMAIDEYRVDDQRPRLMFPVNGTRELLIKHGWIPPKDDA